MAGKKTDAAGGQSTKDATPPAASEDKKPNVRLAEGAKPLGAGPVTVGVEVLCKLPDADGQRTGFYCENAERLVALYPRRFKLIKKLGEES